jgi:hypothetical protein
VIFLLAAIGTVTVIHFLAGRVHDWRIQRRRDRLGRLRRRSTVVL